MTNEIIIAPEIELEGSEKQIAFANSIIKEAFDTVNGNIHRLRTVQKNQPYAEERINAYKNIAEAMKKGLQSFKKASDLIERKDKFSGSTINQMVDREMMKRKLHM